MATAQNRAGRMQLARTPHLAIADLILLRVASGSATRAELQRDLAALVAPKVPGTAFRRAAEVAIGQHVAHQLISETKGRLTSTPTGSRAAAALVSLTRSINGDWDDLRNDALMFSALAIPGDNPVLIKALERAEGLAAIMLQSHYNLPVTRALSPNDMRNQLAVIALEKAFGNKIKTGLGKGAGLPAKTGRMLAGQLFGKPRDITSDGKLLTLLAAEIFDAPSDTLDGLRLSVLRRLTSPAGEPDEIAKPSNSDHGLSSIRGRLPANDAGPLDLPRPAIARPDMAEFAGAVLQAARPVSEGWPGNRKAFISRVWGAIRNARPEWELSEIAFKSMLAEAHRSGGLVLASADLKDKNALKEIEDSKIHYKNTVWHYVRVED